MSKLKPYLEHIAIQRENMDPLGGQVCIVNECVNTCAYCKRDTFPRTHITLEKMTELLEDFNEMKVKALILSGGECLLHPNIHEILDLCNQYKMNTSMITSLAKEIDIEKIVSKLARINVSYDADTQEIYKKTRGRGDQALVKEQLKQISKLKEKYNFQFNVWTVHSSTNHAQIEQIQEFVKTLNVNSHMINVVKGVPRLLPGTQLEELGYKKDCPYSYINFMIDSSGMVLNCCKLFHSTDDFKTVNKELIMGDIWQDRFINIWRSEKGKAIRARIFKERFIECDSCDRAIKYNEEINDYLGKREELHKNMFL